MTLQEKIASVPKLERIDSSIESCIKILEQELEKRKVETPNFEDYINRMLWSVNELQKDLNKMRGK